MKTQNVNTDSKYQFEQVLAKRYESLPEVDLTEREEDNMVKMILNRVEAEETEPKGFFAHAMDKIGEFISSTRLLTFGTPAFNTAVLVIVSITISALVYNDFMKDPNTYMNNTAYVQQDENQEDIADNNETTVSNDGLLSRDPIVYKETSRVIDNLTLTSTTRDLESLLSGDNKDSLNYHNAFVIAEYVLVKKKLSILPNTKNEDNVLKTDWIMSEFKGKLYKHQFVLIGDKDYSNIKVLLNSQQLDKEFTEIQNLRNDINFYDISEEIKKLTRINAFTMQKKLKRNLLK